MIGRLGEQWRLRSRREQWLLLVMAALFALTFAWAGVIRPLGDRLADARERHGRAVIALASVRTQADAVLLLQRAGALAAGADTAALLGRAAKQAGFTAATVTPTGPASATVSIAAVRAPAFFGWVANLQRQDGLIVDQLSAHTNSDATLAVELGVRARSR